MLNAIPSTALFLLGAALLAGCSSHPVKPQPNVDVRFTTNQVLRLVNATGAAMVLLPKPSVPHGEARIEPGAEFPMLFTLREQRNLSPGGEKEFLLIEALSSPYLRQTNIDLILRARFDTSPARDIRVAIGSCLFDQPPQRTNHLLRVTSPPLPGIPSLRLCD